MIKRIGRPGAVMLMAAMLIAAAPDDDVEKGIAEWQAGDYRGAVMTWLPAAARGNAHALFNLGLAHRQGRGVEKDMARAEDFFRRAAAKGHAPARTYVGIFLARRGETAAAIDLWQQSAQEGDAHARYMLGVRYFNGTDLKKDVPRAYAYMLLAANSGLTQAGKALQRMKTMVSPAERTAGEQLAAQLSAPAATGNTAVSAAQQPEIRKVPVAAPQPKKMARQAPAVPASASADTARESAYRVQLGAFSRRQQAETGWQDIKARFAGVLGTLSPIYSPFEGGYRLQVGAFPARAGAAALCGRIQDAGQSCFVAAPN